MNGMIQDRHRIIMAKAEGHTMASMKSAAEPAILTNMAACAKTNA